MHQSESIAGLAASLSLFQASCGAATKNATNPHLKNKYADLGSVWDAVRGPLGDFNLAVVQLPMPSEPGTLKLRTQLVHSSGEWLASEIVMPLAKADPPAPWHTPADAPLRRSGSGSRRHRCGSPSA